jgi:hypothetical protein
MHRRQRAKRVAARRRHDLDIGRIGMVAIGRADTVAPRDAEIGERIRQRQNRLVEARDERAGGKRARGLRLAAGQSAQQAREAVGARRHELGAGG